MENYHQMPSVAFVPKVLRAQMAERKVQLTSDAEREEKTFTWKPSTVRRR